VAKQTINPFRFLCAILFVGFLLWIGCSAYNTLPADWDKDIPGIYEGAFAPYKEVMQFNNDGTFGHEVFEGDKNIYSESGKWSVTSGQYIIHLSAFTQFYDPMNRTFTTNASVFVSYQFSPLPDGKKFFKISADVEFHFCLVRKLLAGVSP
jgi:hypothetical protein